MILSSPESFYPIQNCDLPIFRQDHGRYSIFYAPGYVVIVDNNQVVAFENDVRRSISDKWPAVAALRQHAVSAQRAWAEAQTRLFAPICLTLYLNNECNLGCTYCYSNPSPWPLPRLAMSTIRAGAEFVARNCWAQGCTFTTVFHGGGEPTLHQDVADQALNEIERVAAKHSLLMFRYVATNGVMSSTKAMWMAERFDLIGLSCDGPEPIQGCQRPLWGGRSSSTFVERTAQIVREAGKSLHVRVTVTPQSMYRQTEIAEYICQQFEPQEIHVEPIYQAGRARAEDCVEIDQAEEFVAQFLKARIVAQRYGIPWLMSGSRPWEIHGPYCNVFRDVLNLVPGDVATACFKTTTAAQTRKQQVMIGEIDSISGSFVPDYNYIQNLRQALRVFPPKCQDCFNQYHCVRDCPDYCPLEGITPSSEFGCRVQKMLANIYIQEMAKRLQDTDTNLTGIVSGEIIIN